MVGAPFRFDEDDPRPMLRHLDGWARRTLTSPEAWGSTLERCGQWTDYSARNQALLASYGIAGFVAGESIWAQVRSTEGRGCAVRAGEHGLPVRVPIIDVSAAGTDALPRLGQVGAGRSHAWERVFAVEQLARRPAPDALASLVVPRLSAAEWNEAVRVASGRVVGRMPRRVDDPTAQLGALAERVPHGPGRMRLSGPLAAQAGWLAADRVGLAAGAMAAFDPRDLAARERWRTLVDVRHAAGLLVAGMSHAVGVDLSASPLPRHELVDDRTVAAGRRNYLAPADLRDLPIGVWVEAGPYSRSEWLARGIAGAAGVAGFQRVNDRSYLAVYETNAGAMWRLETTGRGAYAGLVHEGTADTLDAAHGAARVALRDRFPEIAASLDHQSNGRVVSIERGWRPLPDGRDERTEHRRLDDRVTAVVAPGPGGQWQTWATVDGTLRQGALAPDAEAAREVADGLARSALIELATFTPDRANRLVADAANDGTWTRELLIGAVGHRLTPDDRTMLATSTEPAELVAMMQASGVLAPDTLLAVLHAEHVDGDAVVGLLADIGLPAGEAIRSVHDRWGMGRLDVAEAIGATVDDLRAAGCSQVELLAAAPRQTLRALDARESTWQQIAPVLLAAGYTPSEAVAHLAAHAPTPEAFAAGTTEIVAKPVVAFAAAGRRAGPEDLTTLSERYGLDPSGTAAVLAAASVPIDTSLEVLLARCDHDLDQTFDLAAAALGVGEDYLCSVLGIDGGPTAHPAHALEINDESALAWDAEPANAGTGVDL